MAISGVNISSNHDASSYASKAKDESKAKREGSAGLDKGAGADRAGGAPDKSAGSTNTKPSSAADYTAYLQKKFSYLNKSTSMEGVPSTVSVSPAFIAKCANDPQKAKYLEENLAALPECAQRAVNGCPGTLTNLSFQFDANGEITMAISGSSDPDGKIAAENAKRKAKENKEKAERAEEKRAETKAEEKKKAKRLEESHGKTEKLAEKTMEKAAEGSSEESVTGNRELAVMLQEQLTEKLKASAAAGEEAFEMQASSASISPQLSAAAGQGISARGRLASALGSQTTSLGVHFNSYG